MNDIHQPGPRPSIYVAIRVIGCRVHYLQVNGGWKPSIDHWTQSWVSPEREAAYQTARRTGGLLVRLSEEEWGEALDEARASYEAEQAREQEVAP
jgi:hypothetical protein